jgi:3-hydroxyisobutyrate dehydrogenase
MTKVAWIGVGAMGRPMAMRVGAAGLQVRAFDRNPEKLEGLGRVAAAGSIVDAVRDSDLVVVMVSTPVQGVEVLFGEGGIASAVGAGSVVVIMATVGPDAVVTWSERLADQGVGLVDAPVSGGPERAAVGDLLTMVGGDDGAVARAQEVLGAVSRVVTRVGTSPGDGQRMKLVNQLLCGVHIAAAAEALGFAESLGLDALTTWEALRHGAGASFMFESRGPRMAKSEFSEVRGAIKLLVKDLALVTQAANGSRYPTPVAAAAEQLYLAAERGGLGDLDDSSLIEIARGRQRAK